MPPDTDPSLPPASNRTPDPSPDSAPQASGRHPGSARPIVKRTLGLIGLVLLLAGAGAGGWFWWQAHRPWIPEGLVWGNGRVEAEEIDITPKYAGRVAELLVEEGDLVQAGQPVARMDTRDVNSNLEKALSHAREAANALTESKANVGQSKAENLLAQQQIERTRKLLADGYATREKLDQRQQILSSSDAALRAANARVGAAEQALAAAQQEVAYFKIMNGDGTLVSPRPARVEYRLVNTGEVVGAGARIMTLIDLTNVYMTVFLPTTEAGKVTIGSEGRMVLDALPNLVVPGHVTFVSPTSQFTPKTVETKSERDKLMFRVKVRVDPEILAAHQSQVRTGLPGVSYIRLDPATDWPDRLKANVPP